MRVYVNQFLRRSIAIRSINTMCQEGCLVLQDETDQPPSVAMQEMIEVIKAKKSGTWFTQSELFVLLLIKAVQDEYLKPEELELFAHDGIKWVQIPVTKSGKIGNWPGGFFKERIGIWFNDDKQFTKEVPHA